MTTTRHWVLRVVLLAGACLVVTPSAAQQVTVGISGTGAVRFTDASALTCDATSEGSIRYVDASNRVEFCDDTVWTVLGPGGVGTIYIDDLADAESDYTALVSNLWLGQNAGAAIAAGGTFNLAIGQDAGDAITTGDFNVGVGYGALGAVSTATSNTAVGAGALTANTADNNTAVGAGSLAFNNTGTGNVAIGQIAMYDNTWGANNTAVGVGALQNNDGGSENVAIGGLAMRDTVGDDKSTMLGYGAGATGAQSNAVGLGYNTLYQASADNNIAVGYQAGNGITSGASNIVIGYDVDAMSATGSSQLNIGDTIYGDLANDRIRIGGSGTVAAGPLYAVPPATETVAGGAVITANACGTIKPIQSTGSVTTSTANTFTATTVAGCCMDVINVDAADTITLDANGAFKTVGGANQALGPDDSVRVCSNGTNWYQMGAVSANN